MAFRTSRDVRSDSAGAHIPGDPEQPLGDPEAVARQVCLRLITLRPHTRAELAKALAKRGVPDEAAEAVLSRFADVGLIDDSAFAEAWVDSRHRGRGLARRALADELRRKGVEQPSVEQALEQLDPETELDTARDLVRRKLPSSAGLPREARIRRLVGMLARKGYPQGLAFRLVTEALGRHDDDVDPEHTDVVLGD